MKRSIATSLLLALLGVSAILAQSQPIDTQQHSASGIAQRTVVEPDLGPTRMRDGAMVLPAITVTAFVPLDRAAPGRAADVLVEAADRVGSQFVGHVDVGISRVGHVMPYYAFGGAAQPAKD